MQFGVTTHVLKDPFWSDAISPPIKPWLLWNFKLKLLCFFAQFTFTIFVCKKPREELHYLDITFTLLWHYFYIILTQFWYDPTLTPPYSWVVHSTLPQRNLSISETLRIYRTPLIFHWPFCVFRDLWSCWIVPPPPPSVLPLLSLSLWVISLSLSDLDLRLPSETSHEFGSTPYWAKLVSPTTLVSMNDESHRQFFWFCINYIYLHQWTIFTCIIEQYCLPASMNFIYLHQCYRNYRTGHCWTQGGGPSSQ